MHLQFLKDNAESFHHARTPQVLQSHWRRLKEYDLLIDQKVRSPDRGIDFAAIEESFEDFGGVDWEIVQDEMRLYGELEMLDRAWAEAKKVLPVYSSLWIGNGLVLKVHLILKQLHQNVAYIKRHHCSSVSDDTLYTPHCHFRIPLFINFVMQGAKITLMESY